MAIKRKKLKINKKQRKQLITVGVPALAGIFGLLVGISGINLYNMLSQPANLIWSADSSVKVPKDLSNFLASRNNCKNYKGANTPTGVGLWGVYQVSQGKYAKIAYGCSWNLRSYVMAVKQDGKWQLLSPAEYFAPFKDGLDPSQGALPYCAKITQFKIPKDIESFCVNPDGSAQPNGI